MLSKILKIDNSERLKLLKLVNAELARLNCGSAIPSERNITILYELQHKLTNKQRFKRPIIPTTGVIRKDGL